MLARSLLAVRASVVIRVRDGAATLGAVLDALAAQEEPHAVTVVDSGSTDGTLGLLHARGIEPVALAPEAFTYGRALNLGVRATGAATPVTVALSADAVPRDPGWLGRLAGAFEDPTVACAFGEERGLDGRLLAGPVRQDLALARAHPEWGYSNGAGAFRTALWRQRPFREDLPFTEDREWALWALGTAPGRVCLLDPALAVDHDHAHEPIRATFRRAALARRGFDGFLELPPYGARAAAVEWWTQRGWHASAARARLSPRRVARLAGTWWGARRA